MTAQASRIDSVRPEMTAQLMQETGLDEEKLTALVHQFYAKVRKDPMLGPIFAEHVIDWPAHLAKMVDFWSSISLMTGRYHGAPMPAHITLPVARKEFARWLALFEKTAEETCPPEGAALLTDRAYRIAGRLHAAVEGHKAQQAAMGEVAAS